MLSGATFGMAAERWNCFSYVTANAVQRDSFLLLLDHTCLKSLSDILGTSQRGPPLSHPVES